MKISLKQIGGNFWWHWFLGTMGAFFLSLLLIEVGEKPDLGVGYGLIGGAVIGLAQSWVLKEYIAHSWRWMWMSVIAWGLVGGSSVGVVGWITPAGEAIVFRAIYGALHGAAFGIWMGVAQWFALRHNINRAWRWPWILALCWSVGLGLGWTFGGVLRLLTGMFLGELVGLTIAWLAVASLTGIALNRLLSDAKKTAGN
ncbi:MAG TPA: hypothetical protein IGS52_14635 [Oscillatoriaceae cyanobacterium M33_DOE_052]|uniref:Uncharacterized protein n=1 Tax=Planktothricoides sp. SpSt-374 TaxID=2282167 RepID=A0A7C3VUA4_9CYAN|nr:hypothetical protein [Oscillatoriaceae cyanobacterium M33_DOE_052]